MNSVIWRILILFVLLAAFTVPASGTAYPRIANLWGCYPTDPDIEKWAKYDMLVIAGSNDTSWRQFSKEMRSRNPDIIILGTAPLMNLLSPEKTPWMKEEWFVKRPDGTMLKWWADMIYTPNLLIDDCLNALIEQGKLQYDSLLKDKIIDGLMYDSVVGNIRWLGEVDLDGDGKADMSEELDSRWKSQQNKYFDAMKSAYPGMIILANDVDEGHQPHLNGRLFEGATLLDRIISGNTTPFNIIKTINGWMDHTDKPAVTFAIASHPIGWQWWRTGKGEQVTTVGEVDKIRRDFRRMRLGLLTTVMTDTYFYYDVGTTWYGTHLWYAEYDAPLGNPLGKSKEIYKVPPTVIFDWKAGDANDSFRQGTFNHESKDGFGAEIPDDNAGWNRMISTDPSKVQMLPLKTYRIEADLEIVKRPTQVLQFNIRTTTGGWEKHDKGVAFPSYGDKIWEIDTVVTLDDFNDYAPEWHMLGSGSIRLKRLKITQVNDCYLAREFEGGTAILNPNPRPISITLDKPMMRISDDAAPLHYIEVDDRSEKCRIEGPWEILAGEDHYHNETFRKARKPGSAMRWSVESPSTDVYTAYACNPGDKSYTDSAYFTVEGIENPPVALVDQQKSDGGWVKLFDIKLRKGQKIDIVLRSNGAGETAGDAIRLESRKRFNDGRKVKYLRLDPLDGIILLNDK